MQIISPSSYTLPYLKNKRVTILGAGKVAKSILAVSALKGLPLKYNVLARSAKSAELIKVFLNDIPFIDVTVTQYTDLPDLSNELVILCLGAATSERTKLGTKEALYTSNKLVVQALLPRLENSTVIVVTNPSTKIVKDLIGHGIKALGIGVANDQNRLDSSTNGNRQDWYFVGPHDFKDLIIGSNFSKVEFDYSFNRDDYKRITSAQDRFRKPYWRRLLTRRDGYNFEKLGEVNNSFPAEHRWYARQRIHSKFHQATTSCAIATVNAICMIFGLQTDSRYLTIETRLFLEESDIDTVVGWPFDAIKREPVPLTFSGASVGKLKSVAETYKIDEDGASPFVLTTPFGDKINLFGDPARIHAFFSTHLKYLFSLTRHPKPAPNAVATISVENSREFFDAKIVGASDTRWKSAVQHRGKNPLEHTDLRVLEAPDFRAVKFPGVDTMAVVHDASRCIQLYSSSDAFLYHELRRIVRDELAVPLLSSRGARILHGALARVAGQNILVLARSGGGKTTFVLSLLCENELAQYGSCERVATWVENRRLVGVGIPESITVFPGTLSSFAEFEDLARDTSVDQMWNASSKLRLQQDEIVERTSSSVIQGVSNIDVVIEINFADEKTFRPEMLSRVTEVAVAKLMISSNDLTNEDKVRIPWLNWVDKKHSANLLNRVDEIFANTLFYKFDWSTVDDIRRSVREILGEIVLSNNNAKSKVG